MLKIVATTTIMKDRRGQAMLLSTLALGGAILGITTISGMLMLYQIRATTDSAHSAAAVAAADAGTEWALYRGLNPSGASMPRPTAASFSNGASVTVTCYDGSTVDADCSPATTQAVSAGVMAGANRAFLAVIATSTIP